MNYTNLVIIIFSITLNVISAGKTKHSDNSFNDDNANDDTYSSCLKFDMYDTFGDGWHSAKLRIVDEYGHDSLHSVVVGDDHVSDLSYCFDTASAKNGRTVTVGVSGLQPIYGWEVYWTATIDGDDGSVYMGTYNTFMTFEFQTQNNKEKFKISLKSYHNLLTEKKDCMSCSAGDESVAESGGSGTTSSTKSNSNKGQGNSKKSDKSKRILSETAQYELFGDSSWYSLNGYGTAFDISSIDGLTRYYSGGLCLEENSRESKDNKNTKDKSSDNGKRSSGKSCDLSNLTPGEYRWRVSGAYDEDRDGISWKFCGVEGGASTEVLFAIDDLGQCTPLKTHIYGRGDYSSVETSSSKYGKLWTIYGNLDISGFHDTQVVEQYASLLPSLIKDTLNSITIDNGVGVSDTKDVSIISWNAPGSIFDLNTHISFKFEATLIPESYGYDSSSVGILPMYELAENVQSHMQTAIDSGIFMKELASRESLLVHRTTEQSGSQLQSNLELKLEIESNNAKSYATAELTQVRSNSNAHGTLNNSDVPVLVLLMAVCFSVLTAMFLWANSSSDFSVKETDNILQANINKIDVKTAVTTMAGQRIVLETGGRTVEAGPSIVSTHTTVTAEASAHSHTHIYSRTDSRQRGEKPSIDSSERRFIKPYIPPKYAVSDGKKSNTVVVSPPSTLQSSSNQQILTKQMVPVTPAAPITITQLSKIEQTSPSVSTANNTSNISTIPTTLPNRTLERMLMTNISIRPMDRMAVMSMSSSSHSLGVAIPQDDLSGQC